MPKVYTDRDLLRSYDALSKVCHSNNEPIIVTKDGKQDLILMSPRTYMQMTTKQSQPSSVQAIAEMLEERKRINFGEVKEGNAIETNGITKKYGKLIANNNVSIHVPYGSIYGLIGKNGAGKTTLMRILMGLTNANSGSITLLSGEENISLIRRKIGCIIETPTFYDDLTVMQNITIRAMLINLDKPKEDIDRALRSVGLDGRANEKVKTLSLGMRQALGIACAILNRPELLILDEPINGLDPAAIANVRSILIDLNRLGTTILISSHILSELEKLATHYGMMVEGNLVRELTAQQIVDEQISLEQEFLKIAEAGL